ncbi:MAG: hypothetical protein AseanaTS_09210 [Candidatus Pelagadaptatus aseana]|uniref:copper chaperone PCu(A)C n=1 Tax=Candidatus Pelagadaptatus aseana TaxID=3120508 RepID=UPI0039B19008
MSLIRNLIMVLTAALTLHAQAADDIAVSDIQWRAPIPGQSVGVLYFSLSNQSSEALVLTDIFLDWAKKAEFHEHSHHNGMMRMRRVESIAVAPQQRVTFEPGGLHVMVFGVMEAAASRAALPLQLQAVDGRIIQLDAKHGS